MVSPPPDFVNSSGKSSAILKFFQTFPHSPAAGTGTRCPETIQTWKGWNTTEASHLMYSSAARKVILRYLSRLFSKTQSAALLDAVNRQYKVFLSSVPTREKTNQQAQLCRESLSENSAAEAAIVPASPTINADSGTHHKKTAAPAGSSCLQILIFHRSD